VAATGWRRAAPQGKPLCGAFGAIAPRRLAVRRVPEDEVKRYGEPAIITASHGRAQHMQARVMSEVEQFRQGVKRRAA